MPREFFIEAGGLRHHCIAWSPAEEPKGRILLAHGFLDFAWSFRWLAEALVAKGYEVYAFDWRGHGESEWVGPGGYYHFANYVSDLSQIEPILSGDRPCHIFAHSMGGAAVAMYASVKPNNLKSIILAEGLGPRTYELRDAPKKLRDWVSGLERIRNKAKGPTVNMTREDALKRMRINHPKLNHEMGMFLVEKATRKTSGGLVWAFDPLHRTTSPTPFRSELFQYYLAEIDIPVLVLNGENGFQPEDLAARMACIRDLQVEEIADVGHMMHWFKPYRCAEIVDGFIKNVEKN